VSEPWFDPEDDEDEVPLLGPIEAMQVEVTENPVIATFEAVDGTALLEVTERTSVPFGFRGRR
jgi:hypothetical protein